VLIIAHRLTTLRGCDVIVELENGAIKLIGTYDEIISIRNGTQKQWGVSKNTMDAIWQI